MNIYEGSENYIFVSYAHADSDRVLPIIEALDREGFRIWYDSGIKVSSEYPIDIADHIKACHGVIFFVSENSLDSKNCRNEVNYAFSHDKYILVAYIEDTELKHGLDLQLATNQAVSRLKFENDDSFIKAISNAELLSKCKRSANESVISDEESDPRKLCNKGVECFNAKQYKQAFAYFELSAAKNHAHAQSWLGYCYENAVATEKDIIRAAFYYLQAAEQNHSFSQARVGMFYQNGIAFIKNYQKAVYWFQRSVDDGSPDGQICLGICYDNGYGVEINKTRALELYLKAAEQGHHVGQCYAGSCYFNGSGTEQNYTKAAEWYLKSAKQGNKHAQNNISYCYYMGYGVERDYSQAAFWAQKAAAVGHEAAKKRLEIMKQNGNI